MKKILLMFGVASVLNASAQTPCENGFAFVYPCENVDLMSVLDRQDMGGGANMNDIWGWTDPDTGVEYALVGRSNGTSFVDISDPLNPLYVGNLPSAIAGDNLWRDVKVYGHYAVIVSEHGDHGMQIFDLNKLADVDSYPAEFEADAHYTGFGHAHNVAVNEESGYAYGVGTSSFGGGLHIVDINDPLNPVLAGGYQESGYTHDAQIVNYKGPDEDYSGAEIAFAFNDDVVAIVDVTDKADCQLITHASYDFVSYIHQGWLTEDQRYLLVDDEIDELTFNQNLRTHMFDVQDLDNPVYLGYFDHGISSSDHNQYIKGNYSFQSDYSSGFRILDISDVSEGSLSLAGYFDIFPDYDQAGFDGTWSNYPYFESLNVVVSTYDALFVLRPIDAIMVGTEELTASAVEVSVSPNPAADVLTLHLANATGGKINIQIVDMSGRAVREYVQLPLLGNSINLNVADLPSGSYLIKVGDQEQQTVRMIKQ
ncbi:MAG: choice-of-anchor B family protein [Flavobacteriales bacterium]|nr:choice-of-anchor B family protein [Flavobacteriales bacterium]